MIRTLLAVLTAALAGTMVLAGTAVPAHADDEIGLSLDGVTWSGDLAQPLFDPAFRWVPGDDETRSFYVRNQGPTPATMSLAVASTDPDGLLADDDMVVRARAADGAWVDLDNGTPSTRLLDRSMTRQQVVRVDVAVRFVPTSTNQSQVKRLPLRFVVALADDGSEVGGVEEAEGEQGGKSDQNKGTAGVGGKKGDKGSRGDVAGAGLPSAGADVAPWVLWLAAGLLGSGLAFVLAGRRSSDKENENV